MDIPLFQIINYSLILVVLILFIRYLWDMFFDRNYQPVEWQHARKQGRIHRSLIRMEKHYPDKVRFFNWWYQAERLKTERVHGAFAELGVYQGHSARILHCMDPDRRFHLFDTFRGFPAQDLAIEQGEAATYTTANFADTDIPRVLREIAGNSNVIIHPGYFPHTAQEADQERFALVNMDADLYQPTHAGLHFFYPRLNPGGVILIHDYNYKWEGVRRAVDDFMKTIPEALVILPDMDCTVMIVRNK
jgi:O-methyltransferase